MVKFAAASKKASKKTKSSGECRRAHSPFLIASITSKCNLPHCAGCYSRCNHATVDAEPVTSLPAGSGSGSLMRRMISASALSCLQAGTHARRDIIEAAGKKPGILFPIFTNGTFMDKRYFELFDQCRNLHTDHGALRGKRRLPDARRGAGIYDRLLPTWMSLHRRGLIFGAWVTVTTQNIREVSSDAFSEKAFRPGCKAGSFVEYVPVTEESKRTGTGDEREYLRGEIKQGFAKSTRNGLRFPFPEMRRVLAAVWPREEVSFTSIHTRRRRALSVFALFRCQCPKQPSLRDAMHSLLFSSSSGMAPSCFKDDHDGGCALYEKHEQVGRTACGDIRDGPPQDIRNDPSKNKTGGANFEGIRGRFSEQTGRDIGTVLSYLSPRSLRLTLGRFFSEKNSDYSRACRPKSIVRRKCLRTSPRKTWFTATWTAIRV